MNQVHFTFNNFFDYSIIVEQIKSKSKWLFNPDEFTLIFPYYFTSRGAIMYIAALCKSLNTQFTTTLGIAEDIEWT